MNELISVITPVYNSEAYISECLQSVMDQTYLNLEILVIDDGSVDHSIEICNDISKVDERIHVLLQEHKGVSAARNMGLKAAKGKYLFFLDADDVIYFKLLEVLHDLIEKTHSQIAISQYYSGEERNFKKQVVPSVQCNTIDSFTYLDNQKARDYFIRGAYKEFPALCGKLILHSVVQNILFDESLQNGEDTKFIYQVLRNGTDVVILHQNWYYYRRHEGSASKIRSIKSYQNMYICERYVCDQEKEDGRAENAIIREGVIIHRIIEWYVQNSHFNDPILLNYLHKLANDERKTDIYLCVDLREKIKLFLAFHCYPLYCAFLLYLDMLSKISKIFKCVILRSEKERNKRQD